MPSTRGEAFNANGPSTTENDGGKVAGSSSRGQGRLSRGNTSHVNSDLYDKDIHHVVPINDHQDPKQEGDEKDNGAKQSSNLAP